ncbi:unnamed protein product, partial [Brenthis ino]
MTYIQANFCNSMVDMDIYWLQICAAHLPADQFLDMCIDVFGVREWLSMTPMSPAQAAEQDAMVEGLLTFLAILVSSRTNLGNDELTQSRLEVATLLAAGDKTHSQLLELMPERSGNAHTRNFETVLKELSAYRAPPRGSESLEQGLFVPRPAVWERHYDPLHVLRRAVHRRDFHSSMDRFTAYVREKQKAEGASSSGGGALWPPLRAALPPPAAAGDPRQLCASGVLHGALLAVLHRGVRRRHAEGAGEEGEGAGAAPPDHVLALAVYLLAVAADLAAERARTHDRDVCVAEGPTGSGARVAGVPLLRAFAGGAVCDNARTVLLAVPPPPRAAAGPLHRHDRRASDSDPEWEDTEDNSSRASNKSASLAAASTALAVPQSLQMVRDNSMSDDQSDTGGETPEIRALEFMQSGSAEGAEGAGGSAGQEAGALVLAADVDMEAGLALALPARAPADPVRLAYDMTDMEMPEWAPAPALPAPAPRADPQPSNTQVQLHTQTDEQIIVNESIISLLLKLHSQLSGRLDSFSLEEPAPSSQEPIGDGPHFIGSLLHKLAALDARCAAAVAHVRRTLWPHQRERQAEQRARERRERDERARRARERQQQLMREFARRQQQFLAAMAGAPAADAAASDDEPQRDYACVICNTTAPASHADPIGLVVLLQSTSVLGHRRRRRGPADAPARLALSEAERARLAAAAHGTAAAHHYRLHDELQQHFERDSWVLSVSVGWEGGVAAQSCGHHLHLRCLRAYLHSLAAPQRPHNLHVERGEFLCPLCRQLANSVLPLAPPPPRASPPPPPPPPHDFLAQADHVLEMLERRHPPPPPSRLSEAMGKAMEDMTAMAGGKLKQRYGSSPAAIFTFVASLVRTNLECELVQRGGSLVDQPAPRYKPRDDCIVPLIAVAGAHAIALTHTAGTRLGAGSTWRALVPGAGAGAGAGAGGRRRVRARPRAARAPRAHAAARPRRAAHALHTARAAVAAAHGYTILHVHNPRIQQQQQQGEPSGLEQAARLLLTALAGHHLLEDDASSNAEGRAPDMHSVELEVQELVLPFLRIAALLRRHLYGGALPGVAGAADEFPALLRYLELAGAGAGAAHAALPPGAAAAAQAWARQLASAAAGGQLAVHRVIRSLHVSWAAPALLALPRDYDRLFTYYHERVCLQCGAVPKEASVCLLCGTLVCLKQPCCRHHQLSIVITVSVTHPQVAEAVQHATDCGGGTGIFLVVTSTYIIVIRGRRACLWGSLYLDDYDEEDRDLKRGKPLYLSQDRLELLQAQWLAHRFDHTKRTWVWHRDSL